METQGMLVLCGFLTIITPLGSAEVRDILERGPFWRWWRGPTRERNQEKLNIWTSFAFSKRRQMQVCYYAKRECGLLWPEQQANNLCMMLPQLLQRIWLVENKHSRLLSGDRKTRSTSITYLRSGLFESGPSDEGPWYYGVKAKLSLKSMNQWKTLWCGGCS